MMIMVKGEVVNKAGLTEAQFLETYDVTKYERPSVTVDMLIFTVAHEEQKNYRRLTNKVLKILMVKRGDHPYIGQWALPGGFVRSHESLDEAAARELREETNIDNIYMEQLYTWGDIGRDPRTRVISTSYMALVDSTAVDIIASDDAAEAAWFTVHCKLWQEQKTITDNGYIDVKLFKVELSNESDNLSAVVKVTKTVEGRNVRIERALVEGEEIAFDHAKVIQYGIERLKNKIEYTDIAFNLMPELFTLTELQQVYEIILGTELLKANFRRKIAAMVLESNEYSKDGGHRPSKLFRFNANWESASI
jgi:8-oxo-dGTP diphosphatase